MAVNGASQQYRLTGAREGFGAVFLEITVNLAGESYPFFRDREPQREPFAVEPRVCNEVKLLAQTHAPQNGEVRPQRC